MDFRWIQMSLLTMEAFAIIGFVFGLSGLALATTCQKRIEKLEKTLKAKEVLSEDYDWKHKS